MLARRRQTVDCITPCSSGNQKRLDPPFSHPAGWPQAANTAKMEEEHRACDDWSQPQMSGSARWSDVLLTTMMTGAREGSSHASCGGWSMGTVQDGVPATPSPICSPMGSVSCSPRPSDLCSMYHSFASPNQSSSIISDDGMKSESPEEVARGGGREGTKMDGRMASTASRQPRPRSLNDPSPMRSSRGGECSFVKQSRSPASHHKAGSFGSIGLRHPREPSDPFGASTCGGGDKRLAAVDEEERGTGCKRDHHTAVSNLSSDDDYFTGSSGDGSGYENSDSDGAIGERRGSEAYGRWGPFCTSAVEARRNEVEAKLITWKEARTMKLMTRLSKEEAAIDQWEKKQTRKAKMDMKEFELKLDRRRDRALERMQRKIKGTQRKAAKKKLKERVSIAKEISKVSHAFERMAVTGKLPWRLVFL